MPVLTVVIEDILVRDVTLDTVLVLEEMLGGCLLGRVLVNLFGADRVDGRRDSPVDVEPLLRLIWTGLDGPEGLAVPLGFALLRKESAVQEFLDMLEEIGLNDVD